VEEKEKQREYTKLNGYTIENARYNPKNIPVHKII